MSTRLPEILKGEAISPGLGVGTAWIYEGNLRREGGDTAIQRSEMQWQHNRIERAIAQVHGELDRVAEIVRGQSGNVADIFRAHQSILRSPILCKELYEAVQRELICAEAAVQRVFSRWEQRFADQSNEQSRRFADDVADLGNRLHRALGGIHAHPLQDLPDGTVLVAHRLLPSDTVHLSPRSVAGIVVARANRGSHAALLATGRGIPAVGQILDILAQVSVGDTVLVDGLTGEVVLRPDEASQKQFGQRAQTERVSTTRIHGRPDEPTCSRDGTDVQVAANVGNREESILAAENGASGIGLLRLEFLMMSFNEMPNETTLADQLRSVLEPFRGAVVTVRLLDAGGDKTIPCLDLPRECNPSLGRRGVRVLLERPDLLDLQLRVLLRLAEEHEDLRILVPMVTLSEEIRKVHDHLARVASDMRVDRTPPLGAMIETPAAALCVDEIIECSDFLSIGTNDLTQYTMAADRESAAASYYFQDGHPAVLKLVRMVCDRAADLPVWLCGELAGRVETLPTLLELGVRNLSVAPPLVPAIKEAVRESSISSVKTVRDGRANNWTEWRKGVADDGV